MAQSALPSVNGNFKFDRNIKTILKGRYEFEPSKEIEQFLAGAAHPETIPGQKSASRKPGAVARQFEKVHLMRRRKGAECAKRDSDVTLRDPE